jgi:uracil-DNA glycosylase family 4
MELSTMPNKFVDFQNQVEAVRVQYANGEITKAERDATLRQMNLQDEWGDRWMLSPKGEWFRKAKGADDWIRDYPVVLVDSSTLPPIPQMDLHRLARAVHDCTRCPLHEGRTRGVPGEGNPQADLMLIGEGPGFHEDKQARPFVGAAGKFLDELLGNIGYKREEVYITNVVKCRPPSNRDPQPDELSACKTYLDRQIELIDPKVIVTLGRYSMYRYFPEASITKIHGQPKRIGHRLIVPMFHPAAALHQPRWRPLILEDFKKLPQFIEEAKAIGQAQDADPSSAEQLSLF